MVDTQQVDFNRRIPMSRYGNVAATVASTKRFVQSSDPTDLETLVNAQLAAIFAIGTAQAIAAISLAGAGDGDTFVVEITHAPAVSVNGGIITAALCGCYIASDAQELAVARSALDAEIGSPIPAIADEQLAGASKGTRFMGLVVLGTVRTPT
jgi:hypothetical protein